MFILLTVLILFLTALTILIMSWARRDFRSAWLIATGGTFLAWLSVLLWQVRLPVLFSLSVWQPRSLFIDSPFFMVDNLSWPYAFSLISLALAALLTAVARSDFPEPPGWAGILILTGLGLLAVSANNPLTLVLVWAAIDLAELITQLLAVRGVYSNQRVVVSFSIRVVGMGILLWAGIVSTASGETLNFLSTPPQVGLYLLVAAGLRLGVLPLHLPFTEETTLRRGFGTTLRLVAPASSLILLARIPSSSVLSPLTPYLLILTALAALYGGWMWMQSKDALSGRPYLLIGLASLSIASALRANPIGSVAWGCALILSGGVLFLASVQEKWLTRVVLVGTWGLSALPFSPTASGWLSGSPTLWVVWLLFIPAHAFILSGYVRHALHPSGTSYSSQPKWSQLIYPSGIALLPLALVVLGLWGWVGALTMGSWVISLIAGGLAAIITWIMPHLPLLSPVRSLGIRPGQVSWLDGIYRSVWALFRLLGRFSSTLSQILESDGGVLWTMLFMVLFISLLAQFSR